MRAYFCFAIFMLLCSCATWPRTDAIPIAKTQHHIIYVIYRGWHTSILIDAQTFATQSPLLQKELRGEKYARVGFGDGDYFTGRDKSVSAAAKALFASRYSALQLLTYDYDPFEEIPAGTIVPLAIDDEGMRNLIVEFNQSIALDNSGTPVRLPAMGDSMGDFYLGKTPYGAFSNCNTWSGRVLRAAGLPIAGRLTASGVFEQAKFISHVQAQAGLFKSLVVDGVAFRP